MMPTTVDARGVLRQHRGNATVSVHGAKGSTGAAGRDGVRNDARVFSHPSPGLSYYLLGDAHKPP